jgi:hypothetical protein
LTAGLATGKQLAIVLSAILLGIGAQWVVFRTAVTSALREAENE